MLGAKIFKEAAGLVDTGCIQINKNKAYSQWNILPEVKYQKATFLNTNKRTLSWEGQWQLSAMYSQEGVLIVSW